MYFKSFILTLFNNTEVRPCFRVVTETKLSKLREMFPPRRKMRSLLSCVLLAMSACPRLHDQTVCTVGDSADAEFCATS